jgi:hypothetical protein
MKSRHSSSTGGQGLLKLMLVLILGTLSFLLHTWLRTSVVTTSFQVEQSRKERYRLENEWIQLRALRERRLNASRLEKLRENWADQGDLFVEARPEQIIFLPEPEVFQASSAGSSR